MKDFLDKLNVSQREKLMEYGIKYLLERMDLADFPKPTISNTFKSNRSWTPARLRKFRATMKKRAAEKKKNS